MTIASLSSKKIIRDVDLLIHPAFQQGDFPIEEMPPESQLLLGRYLDRAKAMTKEAVLFVFLSERLPTEKHPSACRETLQSIRSVLGRRLIVVCGPTVMSDNPLVHLPPLMLAQSIAVDNDFAIFPNARTFAYGETAGCCVPRGAHHFNRYMGLFDPTTVLTELTDYGVCEDPTGRENAARHIRREIVPKYDRVRFDDPALQPEK